MNKIILTLCTGLLVGLPDLYGQSKLSPNFQHFLKTEQAREARNLADMPQTVEAYLCVRKTADLDFLDKKGIKVNLNLGNVLTAQIPVHAIQELAEQPWMEYMQLASPAYTMMDQARATAGVDQMHSGEGLNGAFTGKDVVVGIIDAGFDYTHPNFYTADGKALRIKRVWEQGNTQGTAPQGFSYGAEYTNTEDIVQASYDVNTNSHGTHVTGIAAGGYQNAWYGVAKDADIVLVSKGKQTPNNVNISDAIAYIYQYAESVGKPCVINMSLGMQIGPHDGTSLFDKVSDQLQGPGKLLVGSAGNFKKMPLHTSKNFTGTADSPLKTMIDFPTKPSTKHFGGEVDIWGEKGMKYDIQIVMYNYSRNEMVCESKIMDASLEEGGTSEFEITKNGTGKVLMTTEINPLNQKPHTYISLQVTSVRSRNALGIIVTPKSSGEVHIWTDNNYAQLTDNGCTGWSKGDDHYTLAEIGGTGKNIISVGAYTSRNTYTVVDSDVEKKLDETMGDIASFSSTGPALDGRMKPEITAPGTFIISSLNSHDVTISSIPRAGNIAGTNYGYGYMQGTSMAAPFVTGTFATWLQANPTLTPKKIREILKTTAVQDDFTQKTISQPNGTWGYGKLDAYAGLRSVISTTGVECMNATTWVDLHMSRQLCDLLFTQPQNNVQITIYTTSGKLCNQTLLKEVTPGQEFNISSLDLPHGVYLLAVHNGKDTKTFKLLK